MPVIITIKYRVREDVLKQFLEEHLGKSPTDTGIVLWYYEVSVTPSLLTDVATENDLTVLACERHNKHRMATDSRPSSHRCRFIVQPDVAQIANCAQGRETQT
jgi:hypothetical protein